MKTTYTIAELDALLSACIAFTDQHGMYFMTGNVAGREGVQANVEPVRRMIDWVAELDRGLLEYGGLGQDGAPYFRLGHDARRVMTQGGFKRYFQDKITSARLEQLRLWAPIVISLLALVVSILNWRSPARSSDRIDALSARLDDLRSRQEQISAAMVTMHTRLDSMAVRLTTSSRTKR